jgi:hypothetical protein
MEPVSASALLRERDSMKAVARKGVDSTRVQDRTEVQSIAEVPSGPD